MRLLFKWASLATLLLIVGCASPTARRQNEMSRNVPLPTTTPFDGDKDKSDLYLSEYRKGYLVGITDKLVLSYYPRDYKLSAGEQGWKAGNAAGFLAHLKANQP